MPGAGIWTTIVTGDATPAITGGWRSLLVKLDSNLYDANPTNTHVEALIRDAVSPYLAEQINVHPPKKADSLVWVDLSIECKAAYEANKPLDVNIASVGGKPTTPKKSWGSWEEFGEVYYNLVQNGDSRGLWVTRDAKVEEAILGHKTEGSLLLFNKYKATSQRGTKSGVFSITLEGAADYALCEDIDWVGMNRHAAESAKIFAEKYILWQNGQSSPEFETAMKALGILRLTNQDAFDTHNRLMDHADTPSEKKMLSRFEPEEIWSWDEIDSVDEFIALHAWRWRFCPDAVLEMDGTWVESSGDTKEWSDNFYSRFIEGEDDVLMGIVGYTPPKDIWEKCISAPTPEF